jgi:large subunit ribosomal protein L32
MAVPKKRTTSRKRNQRRAHDRLMPVNPSQDKETGEVKLPHHISLKDGRYNGRVVLKQKKDTASKKQKTENAD